MSSVSYKDLEGSKWGDQVSPKLYSEGIICLGEDLSVVPKTVLGYYNRIKSFKIRQDDVWIISYPKSGTTWMQEMVWCLLNNLDFEAAKLPLAKRSPYFEVASFWPINNNNNDNSEVDLDGEHTKSFFVDSFQASDDAPSPRVIECHLHHSILPEGLIDSANSISPHGKIIYVCRNPKAVCVSQYHHSKAIDGYVGNLEDFVDSFVKNKVMRGPFWTHVKSFWALRNNPNVLFVKYEDMKMDLPSIIREVALFLGKKVTLKEIDLLADHLSFDKMKRNPSVNYEDVVHKFQSIHGHWYNGHQFMRKGQVDSWKEELSPELVRKLDEWNSANGISELC